MEIFHVTIYGLVALSLAFVVRIVASRQYYGNQRPHSECKGYGWKETTVFGEGRTIYENGDVSDYGVSYFFMQFFMPPLWPISIPFIIFCYFLFKAGIAVKQAADIAAKVIDNLAKASLDTDK